MKYVAPILIMLLSGCIYRDTSLSYDLFKQEFFEQCHRITGIEELHSGSWFTVDGTYSGSHTRVNVGLVEMRKWLSECGRDANSVRQIIE